jgi:hypothetical protein
MTATANMGSRTRVSKREAAATAEKPDLSIDTGPTMTEGVAIKPPVVTDWNWPATTSLVDCCMACQVD